MGVTALVAAAQVPPLRNQILKRVPQGEGPSERKRAKSWFTVELVGEGGGERVTTKVSGGDPGYDETAKMLAESALCLAFDDNPATAGQVTTAAGDGGEPPRPVGQIGHFVHSGVKADLAWSGLAYRSRKVRWAPLAARSRSAEALPRWSPPPPC